MLLLLSLRFAGSKRLSSKPVLFKGRSVSSVRPFFWGFYGRVDSIVCFIRRWFYFVPLVLLCLSFTSYSFGQSSARVTYEISSRAIPNSSGGITYSPTTVKIQSPLDIKFHQIRPVLNKTTLSTFARRSISMGRGNVLLGAAVTAAGYVIYNQTQVKRVTELQEQLEEFAPGEAQLYNSYRASGTGWYPDAQSACKVYSLSRSGWGPHITYEQVGTGVHCNYKAMNNLGNPTAYQRPIYHQQKVDCAPGTVKSGAHCLNTNPINEDFIDLDPSDWEVLENKFDELPLRVKKSLVDQRFENLPISGSVGADIYPATISSSNPRVQEVYNDWPQLKDEIARIVSAEVGKIVAENDPNIDLDPSDQDIIDSGFETEPSSPVEVEFPIFCEWAPMLCEPHDSTQDHPVLPSLDLQIDSYSSGLPGSAACPASLPVVTGFGSWELSFQPACDLASAIRVPLIAISYLWAAFIVVGVRK